MSQTLIQMTTDLVLVQIAIHKVGPENLTDVLKMTYATLADLNQQEGGTVVNTISTSPQVNWRGSITDQSIKCFECGEGFRQLSLRHLRVHGLDPQSYRRKYGIPPIQPLSSRRATARRRELAHEIRPWEKAAEMRRTTAERRYNA